MGALRLVHEYQCKLRKVFAFLKPSTFFLFSVNILSCDKFYFCCDEHLILILELNLFFKLVSTLYFRLKYSQIVFVLFVLCSFRMLCLMFLNGMTNFFFQTFN